MSKQAYKMRLTTTAVVIVTTLISKGRNQNKQDRGEVQMSCNDLLTSNTHVHQSTRCIMMMVLI
jgi:hypothetical protein